VALGGEVANHHHPIALLFIPTHEAHNAVTGVITVNPLEAVVVEVVMPERRF
jgi:hypothetical protein